VIQPAVQATLVIAANGGAMLRSASDGKAWAKRRPSASGLIESVAWVSTHLAVANTRDARSATTTAHVHEGRLDDDDGPLWT